MAIGYNGSITWTTTEAAYTTFDVRVDWKETYDASYNKSTVSITGVFVKSSGDYGYTVYMDGSVSIGGTAIATGSIRAGNIGRYIEAGNTWTELQLKSTGKSITGSVDIIHNADGTKQSTIGVLANSFTNFALISTYDGSSWGIVPGTQNITLYPIPVYVLSVSAGTGATITVNRTSSWYAATGTITSGTRIYTGDVLNVTITLSPNYGIVSATFNGNLLTSGSSYTVSANANVSVTTQVLASLIGATDANIGSVSTITVTRFNSTYKHSIAYSFAGHTGYITASGGTTSAETMLTALQIAFSVPTDWYAYIPSAKSATCTLTCKTYNSSGTLMGTKTASFTATVSDASKPAVSGTVVDVNATTLHLTGDANKLIRYRSTARATITASGRNSATITAKTVNGQAISTTKDFSAVETGSFTFAATDSRGYSTSATVSKTLIAYIPLSCNPVIQRPEPTSNTVTIRITGNIFRGSFGAYSNTLTLSWRYAAAGSGSWSSWTTLTGSASYSGNTYTIGPLTMPGTYDYTQAFDFEIRAQDGVTGYILSTATTGVRVGAGVPVYDWGKNDFAIHGDLTVDGENGNVFLRKTFSVPAGSYVTLAQDASEHFYIVAGSGWANAARCAYMLMGYATGASRKSVVSLLNPQTYVTITANDDATYRINNASSTSVTCGVIALVGKLPTIS